jgi:hypothetical protein
MKDAAPPAYKTLEDAIGGTPLVQLQRCLARPVACAAMSSWASWKATTRRVR